MAGSTLSTTVSTGISLGGGTYPSPLTITTTGYVDANSGKAVSASTAGVTLINDGRIHAISAGNVFGVALNAGGTVINALTGTISGGTGVYGNGSALTLTNYGTIIGLNSTQQGVLVNQGGKISNATSGVISGYVGVYIARNAAATLTNAGRIIGGTVNGAAGILGSISGQITNLAGGTISGRYGIETNQAPQTINIVNAGTITGLNVAIDLFAAGTVTALSGGLISGPTAINFRYNYTNRLVIDPGATFTGGVNGGNPVGHGVVSTLELMSGSSTGTLNGLGSTYQNFGAVTLDAGAQWQIIGTYSQGSFGQSTISGFTYGDSLDVTDVIATSVTFANNHLTLTTGGSQVTLTLPGTFNSSRFHISGDSGTGTEIALLSTSTIISTTLNTAVNLGTFYVSPLTVTTTGFVDAATSNYGAAIYAGTDSPTLTNDGRITGGGTLNGVKTGNLAAATIDNVGTIRGATYGVLFETPGALTNSGTIIGASAGVRAVLTVDNLTGGLVSGDSYGVLTTHGTLTNSGTIQVTGTHATAIYLSAGGDDGTVTNAGVLSGSYEAVLFRADGSLDNSGTITSTGEFGVRFGASGSVTNSGTISATNALKMLANGTLSNTGTGLITGLNALFVGGTGSVFNAATIDATDGRGVFLSDGGIVTNTASGVVIGDGYYGVFVQSAAATIVNFGTLIGRTGIGFYASPSAGTLSQTVIDSGTIVGNGGDAIAFSGGNDHLQFNPSTSIFIQGTVDGGGGTNVLQFRSAATAGTLTGSNAYFVHFTQASLYSGAQWTLAGSSTFANSVSLTNSGTLTVSGTLVNSGSITSAGTALVAASGAVVTNTSLGTVAGGTEGALAQGTATIVNAGVIGPPGAGSYGVVLSGHGLVNNKSTGSINGDAYAITAALSATVINAGHIGSTADGPGIVMSQGGAVTNFSGGTIAGRFGVADQGAVLTVNNSGVIRGIVGIGGVGVSLQTNGIVTNQSGGTISGYLAVEAYNSTATAYVTLINDGRITGSATGNIFAVYGGGGAVTNQTLGTIVGAGGVQFATAASTVINDGLISATGTATNSTGVLLQGGGSLNNQSSGTITGVLGAYIAGSTEAANNTGAIAGNMTNSNGVGIGFLVGGNLTNVSGGVITGYHAISAQSIPLNLLNAGSIGGQLTSASGAGVAASYGATITNQSTGTITGHTAVAISGGYLILSNTGSILGDAGSGAGVFVATHGTITNLSSGVISGSVGINVASSDTIAVTIIDAGTIIGSSGPAVALGAGNDLVQFQSSPSVFIQGAVSGGGGTNTLKFLSGSAAGTLTGSNADFVSFATASVVAGAHWVFAGSNTLGSSVALTDAGVLTNAGTLVVDPPITVTGTFINSSIVSAPGTYTAVYIANGGVVSNTTSGTITSGTGVIITGAGTVSIANLGTIANTGTTRDGINLAAGSIINGASSATSALIRGGDEGIFVQSGAGTIVNFGSIISGANHAIYLLQGGFVSNASSGTLAAGNTGVVLNAAGTVINQGFITGGNSGISTDNNATIINQGTILGAGNNGVIAGANVSVNNQGTIIGAHNYGVLLTGSGSVTNTGVIAGDGQVGVDVRGAGLVANYGTITSSIRPGVEIQGGTVIDAGTISGVGAAVRFYGTNSNLLVLEKGYALTGGVDGSASANNTMELLGTSAGAAVTVSYNSLSLTSVGTIAFATGAANYADLQIASTTALPGTITGFVSAGDTIDLTTFTFVTGSSQAVLSGHTLTVTNGSGTVTLQLGSGSYTGLGFTASTDGATGTDITVGPAAVTYSWIGGSADWQTAADWSTGTVPSTAASATIANAGANTVTIGSAENITVASLAVSNNNTILVDGQFTAGNGVSLSGAAASIAATGTLTGVYAATGASAGTVLNAGLIVGAPSSSVGIALAGGGIVTNLSGGTISAATAISLASGNTNALTVIDFGTIIGTGGTAISFGGGNDTLQFAASSGAAYIKGTVSGGGGTNTLEFISSAIAGTLAGSGAYFVNFQTVSVDAGAQWVLAGTNTLGGSTHLVDSGTLTNTGSLTGSTPLTIVSTFINAGILTAAGASGTGMRMQTGSTVTNASGATITAGQDAITTAGTISISNQGLLRGGAGEQHYGIHATGTAQISNGASGNSAAHITGFYGVIVTGSATIANFGTIAGGGEGIGVYTGTASITNNAGGLISANTNVGVGGFAINVVSATSASVLNLGSIAGLALGVNLGTGDTLVNGASTATTARISSSNSDAVYAQNAATVTNYGTIVGGTGNIAASGVGLGAGTLTNFGLVTATYLGVNFSGNATLVNSGTIAGGSVGVDLGAGGFVNNSGTIRGTGTAGDGIDVFGAGTVVDTGVITSASRNGIELASANGSATIGSGGLVSGNRGIYLFAGGTVVDAGTIIGSSTAAGFNGAGLLVLEHGYKLSGAVVGTTGVSNIIELQGTSPANAVTVSFNGLTLTHFDTIAFASGNSNYATLTISNTASLPGTIVNFSGAHDTIDLTNFAFVSGSSHAVLSGHTLTVTNGSGTVALQLGGGSYNGVGFTASSDGVSGTDITISPAAAGYSWVGGSADWRTAGDWSTGTIPGTAASATIANAGSNTVTISSAESIVVADLSLSNHNTLLVKGTFAPTNYVGITGAEVSVTNTGQFQPVGTVHVAGTIIGGVTQDAGLSLVTVTSAGIINNNGTGIAVAETSDGNTVINQGTIIGTGGSNVALYMNGAAISAYNAGYIRGAFNAILVEGDNEVTNKGTIIGGVRAIVATAATSLDNIGTISASSVGVEVTSVDAPSTVVNSGQITGGNGVNIGSNAGFVTNSGTITGTYGDAIALAAGGAVTNSAAGLLASTGSSNSPYAALYLYGGTNANVVNSGVISGYVGVQFFHTVSGTIVYSAAATLTDTGTIIGNGTTATAISFGTANDTLVISGAAPMIEGKVDGGGGTNTLAFNLSGGTLTGVNADFVNFSHATISAGSTAVFAGSNTLGASTTLVDAGTLTNAGTLVVDPPITVTGAFVNSSIVSAPGTYSAIYIANGGVVSNTSGGTITAGGIAIAAAGTVAISNLGTIQGTTTDAISLASGSVINGATNNTTALIKGTTYGIYMNTAGGSGTVVNYGSVVGLGTIGHDSGVVLQGGIVKNAGIISGGYGISIKNTGTVTNSGTIDALSADGVHMHSGSFNNTGIVHAAVAAISFSSVGSVSDTGTLVGGTYGIDIFDGNASLGAGAYVVGTNQAGVLIGGQIINNGLVKSDKQDGIKIEGFGTATNFGTVLSGTAGSGVGLDIQTGAGGVVVNYGSINGAVRGVYVNADDQFGVTLNNTIVNKSGATITGPTAIYVHNSNPANNTVLAAGAIIGASGTAIALSTGNDLVQFQASNDYVKGRVDGSIGTNTLEFVSAATAGTLSGASSFYNFQSGTVDAGANWTLAGTVTFGSSVTLTNSGTLTDDGSLTVAGSIADGISLVGTASVLSIASGGMISGNPGTTGRAVYASAGTMVNSGTVKSANEYAIHATGSIVVVNQGLITDNSGGVYFKVGGSLNNSGTIIDGQRGVGALGSFAIYNSKMISGSANGIIAVASGSITNAASGVILSGGGASVEFIGGASTIINAGTIHGASFGVTLTSGANTLIDSGTITGGNGTAVAFGSGNDLLQFQVGNAYIKGVANGGGGTNTLEFASGATTGTLTGSGADFVGFGNGTVDAGARWVLADSNTFGSSTNLVDAGTLTNIGSLVVDPPITVTGTFINGSIVSAPGTYTAFYLANHGVLSNASTGTITAGGFAITAAGTVRISNLGAIQGAATDAITMAAGSVINGATNDTTALITGAAYAIVASGPATVANYGSIVEATTTANRGGVKLSAGGSVNNAGYIAGFYAVQIAGGAGTVANSGTISGAIGISLANGGSVSNAGSIHGAAGIVVSGGTATISDTGSITAYTSVGVYMGAGGSLSVGSSGHIVGQVNAVSIGGGAGTVSNSGTLVGTTNDGILMAGGSITNGATNDTTALISGATYGIVASGAATVTNYGSIKGAATTAHQGAIELTAGGSVNNAGYLYGRYGVNLGAGGSVSNAGSILGAVQGIVAAGNATITDTGYIRALDNAIALGSGGSVSVGSGGLIVGEISIAGGAGTVVNSGSIIVGLDSFYGIKLASGGSVLNTGTIRGNLGAVYLVGAGTVSNYGVITEGVKLKAGGTVIDGGTITSGGVSFTAGGVLALTHGYKISGSIRGNSGFSNVLELFGTSVAAAVTATYNSLGLTNFGTVAFAAGNSNYATLEFTNASGTLPVTIASFTGRHDTIDLTALAFVTGSSATYFNTASDKLTITNGTNNVTLTLGSGSYTNINWKVTSDGTVGTDITPESGQSSFNIPDETTLNSVFALIGVGGTYSVTNTNFTLNVTSNFTLTSAVSSLTLASGDALSFLGGGHTIDGGNAAHNFLNVVAPVTINGLALVNAQASVVSGADWNFTGSDTLGAGTLTNAGTITVTGTLTDSGTLINNGTVNGIADLTLSSGLFTNAAAGQVTIAGIYGVSAAGANSVANFGTISASSGNAIYFLGNGNVSNAAGALINAPTDIRLNGTNATVANLGSVNAYQTGPQSYAVYLRHGGLVTNGQAGDTTATIRGYYAIGIRGTTGTVINDATIINTATAGATTNAAVQLRAGGTVVNGASTLTGALINGANYGVEIAVDGSVNNHGSIVGGVDGVVFVATGTVNNYGLISAGTVNGVIAQSSAVVTNQGTITGPGIGIDIRNGTVSNAANGIVRGGQYGVAIFLGGTLTNAGTIQATSASGAGVFFASANNTLIDTGSIIGLGGTAVAFGTGNDVIQFQVGHAFIQGTVDGGAGTNSLEFVSAVGIGTLTGSGADFINFQTASVDTGASWVLAGTDTLGASTTLVDAGTLTNIGSLVVDPPITVTGTFINSSIVSAPGTYTAFYLANHGVLSNTTAGMITAGGYAITAAGTVSISNLGTILGTSTNAIALASGNVINGATNDTTAVINGHLYGITASGAASVANYGTIVGSGTAVFSVGVKLTAGGTINNAGFITGHRYAIVITGGAGTISNSGTIRATISTGISLAAGGSINNAGLITSTVFVTGGAGTLTDTGTMSGGVYLAAGGSASVAAGGKVTGNGEGIEINGTSAGTVINSGSIGGGNQGILLNAGGTVINTGTVSAQSDGQAVALLGSGLVSNYGVMLAEVLAAQGGTVVDGGTIISGGTNLNAIYLRGSGVSNLLVLTHGYAITGHIVGSGSASNTLELRGTAATASVTANYNNLHLTSFSTAAFAAGNSNYATLQFTNASGTPPVTIANFTGLHDTIDLTALSFVTGSSFAQFNTATDRLVVGNGTGSVTLQLGSGNYSSVSFTASSDGASGTDITVGPAVLTYSWIGGSADWQTATNWSSGVIPGITASATIANAGSNTVTISGGESIVVAKVTVSNGNTLDVAGTLAPTGSINVGGAVLSVATSGVVTGTAAGPVITGTGTVINRGSIQGNATAITVGTLLNYGGISATNSLGAAVYGGVVSNFGTISDTGALSVVVQTAGTFVNGSTSATNALIDGVHSGVILHGNGSTVINDGTIIGAGFAGVVVTGSGGTIGVNNAGAIIGAGGASGYAVVALENSGGFATINNTGLIQGTAANLYGVVSRADGSVTNSGTIISPDVAIVIGNGFSDVVTNSGTLSGAKGFEAFGTLNQTLIDTGTIIGSGGTAITFSGGTDLLRFQPSASAFIQGVVNGGTGTSTLEFASGASTGTLTGSAADFINFQTMQVDAGASWVLAGTDTFSPGSYLYDLGSLTIAGSVTADIFGRGEAPITVAASAYLSNGGTTAAIYAVYSNSGTVVNFGTIAASGAGSAGVKLKGAGSVANQGVITGHYGLVAYGYLTVSNSGTIGSGSTDGIFLRGGGSVRNTGVILGSVAIKGPPSALAATINNLGIINGQDGIAFSATDTAPATVVDSGTIIGQSGPAVQFGGGNGLMLFQPSATVAIQGGVIGGTASNTLEFASGASAGTLTGANAYFANFSHGTVDAGATWSLAGSVTLAANVTLTQSGTLFEAGMLTNNGTINAPGSNQNAIVLLSGGTIRNNGLISASLGYGSAIGGLGAGLIVNGTSAGSTAAIIGYTEGVQQYGGTLENYGTILGVHQVGVAVLGTRGGLAVNHGSIGGLNFGVQLANTAGATLHNYGQVSGRQAVNIFLRPGVVANYGSLLGSYYGVYAQTHLSLVNHGRITASTYDAIVANAGQTVTNYGLISGARTGDVLSTTIANTITNFGTIIGGTGILAAASSTAVSQTVIDSGTIIGTGGTAVALNSGNDLMLFVPAGVSIQGVVSGGTGTSTLEFSSAAATGTLTGSGADFINFATASIDTGADWVFAGSNTLGSSSNLTDVGTLTNVGTLVVDPPLTVTGTFINSSIVTAPGTYTAISVANGGVVSNSSSGTITAGGDAITATGTVSITNLGTIQSTTLTGIALTSGSFSNGGVGHYNALIAGAVTGIAASGVATVTNRGTILGTSTAGVGVYLGAGGGVSVLSGTIDGYADGVRVAGTAGTVAVYGEVLAVTGAAVDLRAGGTVIAGGYISGSGTAVVLGGTGTNLLVLEQGFTLHGGVLGSHSASNTVELLGTSATASVTATYNSLGLTNVGTVGFAAGAGNFADLKITSTTVLPGTIVNFAGLHDTIDLTALSYISGRTSTYFNTNSHQLIVTAGTTPVTLQLGGGSYSGIVWVTQNDGGGGTLIRPQTSAPLVIGGTTGGQTVNDNSTSRPFSAVTITDPNGGGLSETVTIALTNGGNVTDADGSLSGAGLSKTGTGVYSLVANNATAAASALHALVFTPTENQVAPSSTITTGFTLTVTDSADQSASDTTTSVIATSVNDPPAISGTVAGQTVNDNATDQPFANVRISDPDVGATETVTITLTAGGSASDADGTLSGTGLTKTAVGTYVLTTGTPSAVTTELDALTFTPTAHQVPPGSTVTTGMTLSATDGFVSSPTTDTTTTVIATALNNPPSISGLVALQATPGQTPIAAFSNVTISDPNAGASDTLSVTLSDPATGTFSNLGGGTYNSSTGVYSITGTPAVVNAAIDGLLFTPVAQSVQFVTDTIFSLSLSNSDTTIVPVTQPSVISVQQVLFLASVPSSQIKISVSPDGSGFAAPISGDENEAVVINSASGVTCALPSSYQAEFLGGSGNATLSDAAVGNALLVGNNASDTLLSSALNDTILGGSGQNQVSVSGAGDIVLTTSGTDTISATGSGQAVYGNGAAGNSNTLTVLTTGSAATIFASGSNLDATTTGGNSVIYGGFGSVGGALNLSIAGANNTVNAGNSSAIIADTGNNDLFLGGFGSLAGGLSLSINGSNDTVTPGDSSATVTGAGNNALINGDFGGLAAGLDVSVSGANDTVNPGLSSATVSASGNAALIYGGFGSVVGTLNLFLGGANDTVLPGGSFATIAAAGNDALIYGSFGGMVGALNVSIGGSNDTINPGFDSVTVVGAGNNNAVFGGFGSVVGALTVSLGGSGNSVVAGESNTNATLFGSQNVIYGGFGSVAGTLNMTDSGTADTVIAGNSAATVTAGSSSNGLWAFGGTANLDFIGGAGGATVIGGSGNVMATGSSGALLLAGASGNLSVNGGSGGTTLYGGSAGAITYNGTAGGMLYAAGSGNETLNAVGSTTNDTIIAGSGSDVLTGGSGSDGFFVFQSLTSVAGNVRDVIANFTTNDIVDLVGYGANEAATALAGAASGGGNTTLTLADNTQITFLNVSSVNALLNHVFSS